MAVSEAPGVSLTIPLTSLQVMDLLGPSLWDMWNQSGQHLTEAYVACVAMEALTILQALHLKG